MNAQLEFKYPLRAGYKKRKTSKAAAAIIDSKTSELQAWILGWLASGALTADECAEEMGFDRLVIRPRFSELAKLNLIEDSGQRRKNVSGKMAIVWTLK